MHFLPVGHERYRSAIRIYLQKQLQKFGTNKKIILQIKKLRLCELLTRASKESSTQVHLFFDYLLKAAALKVAKYKIDLAYTIRGNLNAKIDRETAEIIVLLLLEQAKQRNKINIKIIIEENNVYIIANAKITTLLKRIVTRQKGTFITTENTLGINLPIKKSAQPLAPISSELEYLLNPLSNVNLFLCDFDGESG